MLIDWNNEVLLCHERHVAFFAIPQNASRSIKLWLMQAAGYPIGEDVPARVAWCVPPTWQAGRLSMAHRVAFLRDYWTFVFLRHPVDWLVSAYHALHGGDAAGAPDFNHFVSGITSVRTEELPASYRPQHLQYIHGFCNSIGRVERLPADFGPVQRLLDDHRPLPQIGDGEPELVEIDENTRSVIENRYAIDLALWEAA